MKSIIDIIKTLKKNERTRLKPFVDCTEIFQKLNEFYDAKIPAEVVTLYSATEGGFIQIDEYESWRILVPKDIIDASEELDISFDKLQKMPIIDCKDNNYICYNFSSNKYETYNIVDNIAFNDAESLTYFFKQ